MGTDVCVLERTARISNLRQLAGMELAACGDNYLVCIGVHDEVGIVGDDDDLAALLRLTKRGPQARRKLTSGPNSPRVDR